jgi:hypothetical protein
MSSLACKNVKIQDSTGAVVSTLSWDGNNVTIDKPVLVPTAAAGTNNTQVANTAFVSNFYQPGSVVQVVSMTKTDTFSTTSTSWVDITGFTLSITRKFSNSKVLIIASGSVGMNDAKAGYLRLLSDGNPICVPPAVSGYLSVSTPSFYSGSSDANNNENFAINFLDSPTSSTTTYKFQASSPQGATFYFNALGSDTSGQAWSSRTVSNITLMEIKV